VKRASIVGVEAKTEVDYHGQTKFDHESGGKEVAIERAVLVVLTDSPESPEPHNANSVVKFRYTSTWTCKSLFRTLNRPATELTKARSSVIAQYTSIKVKGTYDGSIYTDVPYQNLIP